MKHAEWSRLRVKIHHDWLLGRYMTFLKAWGEPLKGKFLTAPEKQEFLGQLVQWNDKRNLFQILIDAAEAALSPKQLLDEAPLNVLAEEERKWLGEVVHELYCMRTGIRQKVSELKAMLKKVDMAVKRLEKKLHGNKIDNDKVSGEELVFIFARFSRAISSLPHEVQGA